MEEYKKITVDFSSLSEPTTRKRRKTRDEDGVISEPRARAPPKPRDLNRTMKRNALLKFIRRHQENNRQKWMQDGESAIPEPPSHADAKSDLDDTLDYLMGLTDQVKQKETLAAASGGGLPVPNHTLKKYVTHPTPYSVIEGGIPTNENVSMDFPTASAPLAPIQLIPRPETPKYGCLKGGQLPTYRTLVRQNATMRHPPSSEGGVSHLNTATATTPYSPPVHPWIASNPSQTPAASLGGNGGASSAPPTLKYVRQKRTHRRTYKIGKSPTYPKIGVLISNRTIRKNITTQSHHLKQTPLHEIRQFLVKHGLIKVGTSAPNDVLRKMYESSKMLCGEVYNHNTDVLLHNFVHGEHK